jgi:hypothetical protein
MKRFVYPPNQQFLQSYGTTASSLYPRLYDALEKRKDWDLGELGEERVALRKGVYHLKEFASARQITFHVMHESGAKNNLHLNRGDSICVSSGSGLPPFYCRVTSETVLRGTGGQIEVEFLPIEAHDVEDGGALEWVKSGLYDYCADERLSKIASNVFDARNITNKTNLVQTLASFVGSNGFIPRTYQIQFGGWFGDQPEATKSDVWFLKNSTMDGGTGIVLLSDPTKCLALADRKHRYVVQPGSQRPMLLGGKKFDLRMYVVIAHNTRDCWWSFFQHGLVRKCAKPYKAASLDRAVQLSNYVPPSGASPEFNQAKYELFDDDHDLYSNCFPKITEVVRAIALATRFHVGARRCGRRFHLFAMDFIVDQASKVFLLEVNSSPGLDIKHSGIQSGLIAPMIDGLVPSVLEPLLADERPREGRAWIRV